MLFVRLALFYFLLFGVWGSYLTSLGTYLAILGMASDIAIFYSMQGFVSIVMPAVMGIIADRWLRAERLFAINMFITGCSLLAAGFYCVSYEPTSSIAFTPLFLLYSINVVFFMPCLGLSYSIGYSALVRNGADTIRHYPPIRMFGTIGFICAMLFVNFTGYQNTYGQFFTSGVIALISSIYALTLPPCHISKSHKPKSFLDACGLRAFSLFANRQLALFFVFSMFLGVALQITNGYANLFIKSFEAIPAYAHNWGVNNANAIIALSQASETLCILLIPFFMRRFGIKYVVAIAFMAWTLRFGLFALGNPGSGVVWLILSMIVYGVAFDFFNVSGSLFVDKMVDPSMRSSAQGLFMMMTNGFGASIGLLCAQVVINYFVLSQPIGELQIEGWHTSWFIFAAYTFILGLLFMLLFKQPRLKNS